MKKKLYLGLDVHKDSITIAIALGGRHGEVRLYGTISNDLQALEKAPGARRMSVTCANWSCLIRR